MKKDKAKKEKVKKEKKPNAVTRAISGFFGLTERGGNIKTEIYAGILMFVEVAGFMMVNALLLASGTGFNEYYPLYFAAALTSAITSVLIGILCNAPLVQSVSMGMTVLIISIYGEYSGLTYANILAIGLVANIVYLVVSAIPPVRNFIARGIPSAVRKALPAALGAFLIIFVLLQMGVVSITDTSFLSFLNGKAAAGDAMSRFGISYITLNFDTSNVGYFYTYMPIIMALVGFVLMVILKNLKIKHSAIISFGVTLLIYLICWAIRGNFVDYWLYAFITPSYAEMQFYQGLNYVVRLFKNIFLAVFTEGFDFSAYTATLAEGTNATLSVVGLFLTAGLSFLILGVTETDAAVTGCAYLSGSLDEEGKPVYTFDRKFKKAGPYINVYSVNALSSIVGCALGAGPVVVRGESAVGASEGGKSGLSAIIAGLLLIIAIFNTVCAGVFVNGVVIYALVLFVGFELLTSFKNCDFTSIGTALPFISMVVITAFSMDLALALALSVLLDIIVKIFSFRFKEIGIPEIVVGVLLLLSLIF